MHILKLSAAALLLALAPLLQAEMPNLPATATWYFHADLDAMRDGKAGRHLYDWMDAGVFREILAETGIDVGKETSRMTAFANAGDGPVVLIEGAVSQETRDKVLALATARSAGKLQTFKSSGKTYYFFDGKGDDRDVEIGSLEDAAYLSFALPNKVVVTGSEQQMQSLLASNGRIDAGKPDAGALFVLRADRGLVQAGVNAEELDDDGDWDSNILRNTRQVALLLADLGDKLGFEAQLLTDEAEMANAMASIVRGVISLQAFNDDIDPELKSTLAGTTVDVEGTRLKIALALDPKVVVAALED